MAPQASLSSPAIANFGDDFGMPDPVGGGAEGPRERLNRMVGGDINRSAQVIKQWLASGSDGRT